LPWHLTSGDFWCSIQHNTRDNCALFALLMGLRVDFNNDFATKTLFLKTFSIFMPVNFVLACFSTRPLKCAKRQGFVSRSFHGKYGGAEFAAGLCKKARVPVNE
jgi:hypothetical protein